jgi:hypothetical protein
MVQKLEADGSKVLETERRDSQPRFRLNERFANAGCNASRSFCRWLFQPSVCLQVPGARLLRFAVTTIVPAYFASASLIVALVLIAIE